MTCDVNDNPDEQNSGIFDMLADSNKKAKGGIKRPNTNARANIDDFNFLMPNGLRQALKLAFDPRAISPQIQSQLFNLLVPNDRDYKRPDNNSKLQLNKFIRAGSKRPTQELQTTHKLFKHGHDIAFLTNQGQTFLLNDMCSKIMAELRTAQPELTDEDCVRSFNTVYNIIKCAVIIAHGAESKCVLVTDQAKLDALTALMDATNSPIVLDIETDGLDPYTSNILGIGLALNADVGYYIPLRLPKASHAATFGNSTMPEPTTVCSENSVYNFVRNVLAKKKLVAHNAKFEYQFFKTHYSVELDLRHDTMVAEYILDCRLKGRFNLGACVKERFPMVEEWKENKDFFKNLSSIAISKVGKYCAKDCCNEYLLFLAQYYVLREDFSYIAYHVDMPFIKISADAELQGFVIDQPYLIALNKQLKQKVADIDVELKKHIGDANPDSPAQLRDILFNQLKFEPISKTASGVSSVDADTLEALQKLHKHEVLDLILDRRGTKKLEATYTLSFIEKINKITGNIHPSFMTTDTETGRLSCRNPNFGPNGQEILKSGELLEYPKGEHTTAWSVTTCAKVIKSVCIAGTFCANICFGRYCY